jgi:hypothetical protein
LVLPMAAAWIVAALFAVHPVHVEAVANVVGQSELIVGLCSVLAVDLYVRMRTAEPAAPTSVLAGLTLLYAMACFAKETGFLLPALLAAAEITIVAARIEPARRTMRARAREIGPLYLACGAVAVTYLAARRSVLGGVGDLPSVVMSRLNQADLTLTMLGVVPEWARLLLWPAQLSADYSPPRIALLHGLSPAIIPGLVILVGAVLLAVAVRRVPGRVAAFGLIWLAITLLPVSNLIVRSGVILAERTLFLPSVGAMLALGPLWAWCAHRMTGLGQRSRRVAVPAMAALAGVLILGAWKSASRGPVWRNDDSFFGQIVEDSPRGYRAHHVHGVWLFDKGRRADGEKHMRTAIALFPYDAGPYTDLADRYRFAGFCVPARDLYQRAIELGMLRDRARMGLVVCLLRDGHYADAAAQARLGASARGFQVRQFERLAAIADSAAAATILAQQAGAPRNGRRR